MRNETIKHLLSNTVEPLLIINNSWHENITSYPIVAIFLLKRILVCCTKCSTLVARLVSAETFIWLEASISVCRCGIFILWASQDSYLNTPLDRFPEPHLIDVFYEYQLSGYSSFCCSGSVYEFSDGHRV